MNFSNVNNTSERSEKKLYYGAVNQEFVGISTIPFTIKNNTRKQNKNNNRPENHPKKKSAHLIDAEIDVRKSTYNTQPKRVEYGRDAGVASPIMLAGMLERANISPDPLPSREVLEKMDPLVVQQLVEDRNVKIQQLATRDPRLGQGKFSNQKRSAYVETNKAWSRQSKSFAGYKGSHPSPYIYVEDLKRWSTTGYVVTRREKILDLIVRFPHMFDYPNLYPGIHFDDWIMQKIVHKPAVELRIVGHRGAQRVNVVLHSNDAGTADLTHQWRLIKWYVENFVEDFSTRRIDYSTYPSTMKFVEFFFAWSRNMMGRNPYVLKRLTQEEKNARAALRAQHKAQKVQQHRIEDVALAMPTQLRASAPAYVPFSVPAVRPVTVLSPSGVQSIPLGTSFPQPPKLVRNKKFVSVQIDAATPYAHGVSMLENLLEVLRTRADVSDTIRSRLGSWIIGESTHGVRSVALVMNTIATAHAIYLSHTISSLGIHLTNYIAVLTALFSSDGGVFRGVLRAKQVTTKLFDEFSVWLLDTKQTLLGPVVQAQIAGDDFDPMTTSGLMGENSMLENQLVKLLAVGTAFSLTDFKESKFSMRRLIDIWAVARTEVIGEVAIPIELSTKSTPEAMFARVVREAAAFLKFIFQRGYRVWQTGSVYAFFQNPDKYVNWVDRTRTFLLSKGEVGSTETTATRLATCETLLEVGRALELNYKLSSGPRAGEFTTRVMVVLKELETEKCALKMSLTMSTAVPAPFSMLFYGPPSTGKSYLVPVVGKIVASYLGIQQDSTNFYNLQPTLKFDDAYRGQQVIILNDIGILKEDDGLMLSRVMDLVDPLRKQAHMADVSDKGKMVFDPRIVLGTSNHLDMNATSIMIEPTAAQRRMPWVVYMMPYKEYCSPNSFQIEPTLVPLEQALRPDPVTHHFYVYQTKIQIDGGKLVMVYHPIVDIEGGELVFGHPIAGHEFVRHMPLPRETPGMMHVMGFRRFLRIVAQRHAITVQRTQQRIDYLETIVHCARCGFVEKGHECGIVELQIETYGTYHPPLNGTVWEYVDMLRRSPVSTEEVFDWWLRTTPLQHLLATGIVVGYVAFLFGVGVAGGMCVGWICDRAVRYFRRRVYVRVQINASDVLQAAGVNETFIPELEKWVCVTVLMFASGMSGAGVPLSEKIFFLVVFQMLYFVVKVGLEYERGLTYFHRHLEPVEEALRVIDTEVRGVYSRYDKIKTFTSSNAKLLSGVIVGALTGYILLTRVRHSAPREEVTTQMDPLHSMIDRLRTRATGKGLWATVSPPRVIVSPRLASMTEEQILDRVKRHVVEIEVLTDTGVLSEGRAHGFWLCSETLVINYHTLSFMTQHNCTRVRICGGTHHTVGHTYRVDNGRNAIAVDGYGTDSCSDIAVVSIPGVVSANNQFMVYPSVDRPVHSTGYVVSANNAYPIMCDMTTAVRYSDIRPQDTPFRYDVQYELKENRHGLSGSLILCNYGTKLHVYGLHSGANTSGSNKNICYGSRLLVAYAELARSWTLKPPLDAGENESDILVTDVELQMTSEPHPKSEWVQSKRFEGLSMDCVFVLGEVNNFRSPHFKTNACDTIYSSQLPWENPLVPPHFGSGTVDGVYQSNERWLMRDLDGLRQGMFLCTEVYCVAAEKAATFHECAVHRVLTLSEAIVGIPGEEYISRLEMSTGAGYPFSGAKSSLFEDPSGKAIPSPVLLAQIQRIEALASSRGVTFSVVASVMLKDEYVSKEKALVYKARCYSVVSVGFNIVFRRYFLPWVQFFRQRRVLSGSAVGLNCFGREWSLMAEMLGSAPAGVIAGDYKGFDKRLPYELVLSLMYEITSLVKRFNLVDWVDVLPVMWRLMEAVARPVYIWKGSAALIVGSLISGISTTTDIGTSANDMILRMAVKDTIVGSVFEDRIYRALYGDDHVVVDLYDGGPRFSIDHLAHFVRARGMEYTSANKVEAPRMLALPEVRFLKRGFVLRGDGGAAYYSCPLDIKSVKKMAKGVIRSKKIPFRDQCAFVLWDTYFELLLHDQGDPEIVDMLDVVERVASDVFGEYSQLQRDEVMELLYTRPALVCDPESD